MTTSFMPNLPGTSSISPDAVLGARVSMGPFCVIHSDVVIGKDVELGTGVVLHSGTRLGDRVIVQDGAIIGKRPRSASTSSLGAQTAAQETQIGDDAVLGSHTLIYAGCKLCERVFLGDSASLRENCQIGSRTTIGRSVNLEFDVNVGSECLIFTGTYLSEGTKIEDEVFIGARVCSASGKVMSFRRPLPCGVDGPLVRRGARIGTGAVLHPGIEIGFEGVVAAGAVVFESVPHGMLVIGNPARIIRRVSPEEYLPQSSLVSQNDDGGLSDSQ